MAEPTGGNTETAIPTGLSGPAVYVPGRFTNSHRKAGSPRPATYETHTVASWKHLEGTGITRGYRCVTLSCDLDLTFDLAVVILTYKSCQGYISETVRCKVNTW